MESLSPQVVAAAKLPILNPNEFNLWKMRIEQYFLMTGYSLWEVILNGDSPIPTRVVDGVVQPVAPTTAEQRLAKKNELKARGTLLMALPNKHQLKFNTHKDAKCLMEAIEKRFGGNKETKKVQKTLLKQQYENFNGSNLEDQSLDDLFNNLKIYEAEIKSLSSTSPTTQNIAFVSSQNIDSTNESVSVVTSVSAASTKVPVFALPNVDNLSDAVIYSFFARFDMSKVECYNCHRRGHFARECKSPKDTSNKETQRRNVPVETSTSNVLVSQCDGVGSYDWSFRADEEPTNYTLMAFTSSSSSNSDTEDIKLLKLDVMLRDNALELKMKFEKAEQERDELKLKLENFQTSLKSLSKLLASQITNKTRLGYDNQVFNSTVFDCDELISSESDVSMPTSPVPDRYKSGEGYHVVPPPYTGTFMPPKPGLVFYDASTANETIPTVLYVEPNTTKPNKDLSQSNRQIAELDADEDVTLEEVDAKKDMDAGCSGEVGRVSSKELAEVEEVIEVVTAAKLITEVVTTATTTINAAPVPKASAPRRRRDNDVVDQVKRKERQDNRVMRYQALKRKPVTEAHARKNIMVYLKNMVEFKMDFFRGMTYLEIRPIFEKHYNCLQAFLEKREKEIEKEDNKRKSESSEQRAAKKQKIDEEPVKKAIKIKELRNELYVDGAAVTIPIDPVEFDTKEGMESVMENGPWLIRRVPLILNEWTANTILKKDEIKRVPVWEVSNVKVSDDGFTKVKKKKVKAKKNNNKQVEGVRLTKPALNLQYHRVEKGETSKRKVSSNVNMKSVENDSSKHLVDPIKFTTTNSFSALAEDDSNTWDEDNGETYDNVDHVANNSDSEDVDEYITMEEGTKSGSQESSNDQGESTPFEGIGVIHQDPQVIHTGVWIKADRKEFFCSIVYAYNYYIHRRRLWNGLCLHKNYINNRPWCLLGDFNASLYVDDTSIGPSTLDIPMREFKECVETMEVMDVQRTGLHFTWNQKPKGKNGILRKLDRILANLEFQDRFVGAHAIFKPYRISDHSSSVLYIPSIMKVKPNPFKSF
nr:RNA-directed DNA polymerase, eukaryota, reverse transcriptase zinc-binding domain protein [Tanacetum cinerariifolium]